MGEAVRVEAVGFAPRRRIAVGSRAKGKFRFRLKAGDGEIIATGEAYESKASAKNGIASVQTNAADREGRRPDPIARFISRRALFRSHFLPVAETDFDRWNRWRL